MTRSSLHGRDEQAIDRIIEIAADAGAAIMAHYDANGAAWLKADATPVTAADFSAHEVIVDRLREWDPGIPVISEEAPVPAFEMRRAWRRFWLVDPLDGTKEFISRNGEFTVNIALVEDGEPVLGVVSAPALSLIYAAAKNCGAWRIDDTGKRRRLVRPERDVHGIVTVVESRSHPSEELETWIAQFPCAERVCVGSSIKFCYLAEGKADVYPRFGPTMEWDVAAGDCIYRNSARTGQFPSPLTYNKPDLRNESFVIGDTRITHSSNAPADGCRSLAGRAL